MNEFLLIFYFHKKICSFLCLCDRASLTQLYKQPTRSCLLVTSPAGSFSGALYRKLYTQSSAPEHGRNYRPKHVELIEITNKLLLLHLVGCL